MTDRRRNPVHPPVRRRPASPSSAVVVVTKPTKLGLDLKGGVARLPGASRRSSRRSTGEAVTRTIDIMRERVDKFGVAEPEIQRTGARPDRRLAPGRRQRRPGAPAGRQDGPAVLLRLGDERPRRRTASPTRRTRPSRAARGRQRHRRAQPVRRGRASPPSASRRTPARRRRTARYYLVNTKTKKVLAGRPRRAGPRTRRSRRRRSSRGPEHRGREGPAGHGRVGRRVGAAARSRRAST